MKIAEEKALGTRLANEINNPEAPHSGLACSQAVGWSKKPEFVMRSPSWIRAAGSGPAQTQALSFICTPKPDDTRPY